MKTSSRQVLCGILFFILFLGGSIAFCAEAVLTVYVTRHGQRGPRSLWPEADRNKIICGDMVDGKISRPAEQSISPLGMEQAKLLGAFLKNNGFNGKIYASPAYRTMQTAVCIAREIDPAIKVIPEPELQGGGNRKKPARGMTVAEFQKRFPGNVADVKMPEFWKLANEFTSSAWGARMEKYLEKLLKNNPSGKVLVVGHSSTLPWLIIALDKKVTDKRLIIPHYPQYIVNCCLYVFKINKDGKVFDIDLENYKYLDGKTMTNNFHKLKRLPPPRKKIIPGRK